MSDWLYEAHTVNALSETSEDGNAVFRYLPQGWSTDTGGGGTQGWGEFLQTKAACSPYPHLAQPHPSFLSAE